MARETCTYSSRNRQTKQELRRQIDNLRRQRTQQEKDTEMVFTVLKSGDQAQIASAMQSLHYGGDSATGICGSHMLADGNLSGGLAAAPPAAGSSSRPWLLYTSAAADEM